MGGQKGANVGTRLLAGMILSGWVRNDSAMPSPDDPKKFEEHFAKKVDTALRLAQLLQARANAFGPNPFKDE
jgi:hypothetical protein